MTRKTWEIIVTIAGVVFEVLILMKDKLIGGKNDTNSGSGSTKAE
jgi:hypothetical protein